MESNLKYDSIEAYADQYTQTLLSKLSGERIKGIEIVELMGVKQVNLLVLKNLFDLWSLEVSKQRSKYFDYDADEVKSALEVYMNALSRHISIKKEDFKPLLKSAVVEAILLVFSPFNYFGKEIKSNDKSVVLLKDLKSLQRYIKVNKHLLDAFVKEVENIGKEELSQNAAYELFNHVCGQLTESPDDIQTHLEKFNQVASLKTSMIYFEDENIAEIPMDSIEIKESHAQEVKAEIPKEAPSVQSYIQEIKEEQISINEKLSAPNEQEQPTLLDKLNQKTLGSSIKKSIGLNQRIMFTKVLFGGEQALFNEALEKIDEQNSLKETIKLIKTDFAAKGKWDFESEEVQEFMELIELKFK